MAGTLSNAFEQILLKHMIGESSYNMPATLYCGLATAVTDLEAGTFTECADAAYARQPVTWAAANGGASSNSALIQFPAAASGYTVEAVLLFDHISAGNFLGGDAAMSQAVGTGEAYQIPIGDLDISLA